MPSQRTTTGQTVAPVAPREPFSALVLGVGNGNIESATDSMMVMSYDPHAHTASILSVPRDLWVDVPGFGQDRINTAYAYGGTSLAELTVEKALDIPIEYYAIVNYGAFVNLVNKLGGVNVVVPPGMTGKGIYDPTYPNTAENANTLFVLPAGPQHLDGTTALKFIRERHSFATSDLQRQADQQQVLMSLKQQILEPRNWAKLPSIIGMLAHSVTTNVPYADIPPLANAVLQLPKSNINTTVFEYPTITNWTTPGGAEVLLPNSAAVQQIVQQDFQGVLSAMRGMTVQVENGAATQQPLATYFTGVLQGMGVKTLPAETAARTDYRENHVFVNTAVLTLGHGQPIPTEADMLGQMLNAQVQQQAFPDSQAQIVVILGAAFPSVQQS